MTVVVRGFWLTSIKGFMTLIDILNQIIKLIGIVFSLIFLWNFFCEISYEISVDSPMMRVLGLVFAFNLLLLTAACTFCCLPCCCFWYSVNCLLLLLNCFVVLLLFVVDFFLFVVAFTVGFVENCLLLVIVALNCLLLKLLMLLLLESSIILCNWLKLLKSSNPCIDGDDIGDSKGSFQSETPRWRSPHNWIDQSESDYQFENHPNGESSNSFKYSTLSASYSSKLSSEYILNRIDYIMSQAIWLILKYTDDS